MVEATPDQVIATGAAGGYGVDPVDGDRGYTRLGQSNREMPAWNLKKARAYSVAAYRANPMARAIIDTYTSFCVGDKGITFQCSNAEVEAIVRRWWRDPRNALLRHQTEFLRDHMLMGETCIEAMQGNLTGLVRYNLIDAERVSGIELLNGNPLWFDRVSLDNAKISKQIIGVDDFSELLVGEVHWFRSWNALLTDRRGVPFLVPVLDDLDNYDAVLNNLVDRTALMRYIAMTVEIQGDQDDIDEWIERRGGTHLPTSGTVEVHNQNVKFNPLEARPGAYEDSVTLNAILTNTSAGAGLAKTFLAEPEGTNRATATSMAEPVRRRIDGVQRKWFEYVNEMAAFAIDRAVASRMLPAMVESRNRADGTTEMVPARDAVTIVGPEIAASNAEVSATMLLNLGQAIESMRAAGVLSGEAAALLVQRGWEIFTGEQFRAELAMQLDAQPNDPANMADTIDIVRGRRKARQPLPAPTGTSESE
jgi:hypothetical protein